MYNQTIKIFDICGTLYHSNTTVDFCKWSENRFLIKNLLKFSTTLPGRIINKVLEKVFHYDWIRSVHIWSLKGKSISLIDIQADQFVSEYLDNKKVQDIHELMALMDKKDIILVSATLLPVAKAIANHLGILRFYGTTLGIENNHYTGKIERDLSGKKHILFENLKVDFIATDNLDDCTLCSMSAEVIIVSKAKHLKLWSKKNIRIDRLIKV